MKLDTRTPVRPSGDLVSQRPELEGQVGTVLWLEEDEAQAVVQWEGLRKPYRIPTDILEPVEVTR